MIMRISAILLLFVALPQLCSATQVYPLVNFDDFPVNANSDALPQSSPDWTYGLRTAYGANTDMWTHRSGTRFLRYSAASLDNCADNNSHMGFTTFGYLEIDDLSQVFGRSLKYTITGGTNSQTSVCPNYGGLNIKNKAELLSGIGVQHPNTTAGTPDIYFFPPGANCNPNSLSGCGSLLPSGASSNVNRLTFYYRNTTGDSVVAGNSIKYPTNTVQTGPFSRFNPDGSVCTTSCGHFYEDFPVLADGSWAKIQMDEHPRWHNSGRKALRNIPGFIRDTFVFYVASENYEGSKVTPYSVWYDEFNFEYDDYAPQNEETINGLAVSYNPATKTWGMGFHDKYSGSPTIYARAAYELRYSFAPITNENWSAAIPVSVQAHSVLGIEPRIDGRFRRLEVTGYTSLWIPFKLASAADESHFENTSKRIYFAVKDISQNPLNLSQVNPNLTGSLVGQGRDYRQTTMFYDYAVDVNHLPYIKRMDYALPGASPTPVVTPTPIPTPIPTPTPAPTPDTTAPVVSLSSPASGASLKGSVTLAAHATDNVGVTQVAFYSGSNLLGVDSVAPFAFTWNTASVPGGTVVLTARAQDAAGNTGISSPVTVTVRRTPKAPRIPR